MANDTTDSVCKLLHLLPLLSGLLPLLAFHMAYLLSAAVGHVEWCFPYVQGCTSISATGRQPPEELIFKGLLIPGLTLMVVYWLQCRYWLLSLGCGASRRVSLITALGAGGAMLLVVYVVSLGENGGVYQLLRRASVNLGAGLIYMAQLLLYGIVRQHTRSGRITLPMGLLRWNALQVWLILAIGLASVFCKTLLPGLIYDRYLEDPFEWNLIVLLLWHFFLIRRAWLTVTVTPAPGDGSTAAR